MAAWRRGTIAAWAAPTRPDGSAALRIHRGSGDGTLARLPAGPPATPSARSSAIRDAVVLTGPARRDADHSCIGAVVDAPRGRRRRTVDADQPCHGGILGGGWAISSIVSHRARAGLRRPPSAAGHRVQRRRAVLLGCVAWSRDRGATRRIADTAAAWSRTPRPAPLSRARAVLRVAVLRDEVGVRAGPRRRSPSDVIEPVRPGLVPAWSAGRPRSIARGRGPDLAGPGTQDVTGDRRANRARARGEPPRGVVQVVQGACAGSDVGWPRECVGIAALGCPARPSAAGPRAMVRARDPAAWIEPEVSRPEARPQPIRHRPAAAEPEVGPRVARREASRRARRQSRTVAPASSDAEVHGASLAGDRDCAGRAGGRAPPARVRGLSSRPARGHRDAARARAALAGGADRRREEPDLPAPRQPAARHHAGRLASRLAHARPGGGADRARGGRHLPGLHAGAGGGPPPARAGGARGGPARLRGAGAAGQPVVRRDCWPGSTAR